MARFQYSLCRVVLMAVGELWLDTSPPGFQYSLCRVVLMAYWQMSCPQKAFNFQYSLCRVVLMVALLQRGQPM